MSRGIQSCLLDRANWRWRHIRALVVHELKMKKLAPQKDKDFHHNVYVVLLKNAVTKHPSILRLNPKPDPLKPYVYVGMTGIPVDHRLENHRNERYSGGSLQLSVRCSRIRILS